MSTNPNLVYDEVTGPAKDEFTEMLEGMTKQELVNYARMTYGLSVTARYNKADLVQAIKGAAAKFKMNADLQFGTQLDDGLKPGYAEIQLHRTELTKNMKSAIVGVNGKFASLPIGHKFGCPLEYVHVLENAERIEYEQDTTVDPPELVEKRVHAYPFTVHRVNPHTDESLKQAKKLRGLRGRDA